ncbi:hypothetical protein LJC56_11890 [Christensenellaceae bacterium OttesenSCG-928-K19]|nr:hypothetical protein [Christensenellaceae bacterium OttesenSCG-928-K19]
MQDVTGLYYMNARHYNPDTGRFMQQDSYRGTKGDPRTHNLYTYCANNPVNYTDPTGHCFGCAQFRSEQGGNVKCPQAAKQQTYGAWLGTGGSGNVKPKETYGAWLGTGGSGAGKASNIPLVFIYPGIQPDSWNYDKIMGFVDELNNSSFEAEYRPVYTDTTGNSGWWTGFWQVTGEKAGNGKWSRSEATYIQTNYGTAIANGRPVILMGHSGGGQVAYNVASQLAETGRVSAVVTYGAPLAYPNTSNVDIAVRVSSPNDWISNIGGSGSNMYIESMNCGHQEYFDNTNLQTAMDIFIKYVS